MCYAPLDLMDQGIKPAIRLKHYANAKILTLQKPIFLFTALWIYENISCKKLKGSLLV